MGLFKATVASLLVCTTLFGASIEEKKSQMLYLMHHQKSKEALELYLNCINDETPHNFTLLRRAALALLQEGAKSEDTEIQLMCALAAGICQHPSLFFIHRHAVQSKDPQLQLATLSVLGQMHDEDADALLFEMLNSPFLLLRLEAIFMLAKKGRVDVFEKMQSLFAKVPPIAKPLFPQIVSLMDTPQADRFMRQLLNDQDFQVRVETLQQVCQKQMDQFLPQVRRLATQTQLAQQESALVALGALKDLDSMNLLEKCAQSPQNMVRLAALQSLFTLGRTEYLVQIEEMAQQESLFAIALLGKLNAQKSIPTLRLLAKSPDLNVRINALFSLLQLRDPKVAGALDPLLIKNTQDWGFLAITSPGRSFQAIKMVPCVEQNEKHHPLLKAQTVALRRETLLMALELGPTPFLRIAQKIFDHGDPELIPQTIQLLENIESEEVVAFLKKEAERMGAPFIRHYATLALFRLNQEGPWQERLISWIKEQKECALIQVKQEVSKSISPYQLSYEEKTQLFIETLESLALKRNRVGIETLIDMIANGNQKNRYALAGLLMKMAE